MLTPPGLKGKQYRITGTAYPRLRRPHQRRRHVLLAVAGVLTLSVLTWGTVQLVGIFSGSRHTAAAAACIRAATTRAVIPSSDSASSSGSASGSGSADGLTAPTGPPIAPPATWASGAAKAAGAANGVAAPNGITVNVYNATGKAGLAGRTAALLKQRGFTIGTIGNAPAQLQNKVTGSAQVAGGSAGVKSMTVLRSEVAGAVPVTDKRKDASVDLILGNSFTALATPAQAAQAQALANAPAPSPSGHC